MTIKTPHRVAATVLAFLFLTATLVVGNSVQSARADTVMTLSASNTASILIGDTATVKLNATNSTGTSLYNLSFTDALPAGVTYVSGSTTPSTIGDPDITTITDTTNPSVPVTRQVLVWSNVSDLIAGNSSGLSFGVKANTTTYPVGSSFTNTSNAYANSDPRVLPKFSTTTGVVVAGSYTNSDSQTPTATKVSAIKLTKSQPNPESELMRGIHSETSTFTLKVQNNSTFATNNTSVVDYLPAQLEYLGCGATDNSTNPEYTGAPSLTKTAVPANCSTPVSVSTVSNPTGYPAGVYTRIEWNLGNLSVGQLSTLTYAVGIPLKANTMTFSSATPSAASLAQTANLDNNNGASTRQSGDGATYTNNAVAAGTYTGPVASGTTTAVSSSDTSSVQSSDISIVETASTTKFVANANFTYDMLVRTSEYASSSAITVTDTVPNGICPNLPAGTNVIGTLPADCKTTGTVTGATIRSATVNSDGSFTIVFDIIPSTLAADTSTHIVYGAKFRGTYNGATTDPTASGDDFSNGSKITAASTPVAATGYTGNLTVTDDSATTQSSSNATISKKILPRTNVTSATDCKANYGSYVDASAPTVNFVKGDRVCFQLTVNFSDSTDTRNAAIKDFFPAGTTYEGYSVGDTTQGSTVPASEVSAPTGTASSVPVWKIGHAVDGDTTNLFVTKGQNLVIFVSGIVNAPSTQSAAVDITANLMKYSQQNTTGSVFAIRDKIGYGILPAPTASLTKTVTAINGAANIGSATAPSIREGNTVDFSIVPKNTGTAALGNNQAEKNLVIWDALPINLNCATISNISAGGICTDNYSGLTGSYSGKSAIVWNVAGPIAAGTSGAALTYRATVPTASSDAGYTYVNTASITSFKVDDTAGLADSAFYPTASLDTSLASLANTTSSNTNASLVIPAPSVTKTGTTPVLTNNTSDQVVAGELANYQYTVTVPANTTLFNGVVKDTLPSTLVKVAGTTATSDIPSSTTVATSTGYTTAFPATYTNGTASPQTFTTTITGLQVNPAMATSTTTIVNTAVLTSNASLNGTVAPPAASSKVLNAIYVKPTLSNTVDVTSGATAGQTIKYTLTAYSASSSAPAGYDTILVDCLPAGITFQDDANGLPSGVTRDSVVKGDGVLCPTNATTVKYNLGTLVPSAPPVVLNFNATIDSSAVGNNTYTANAKLTTSTLSDGALNATNEALITAAASASTAVAPATIAKSTTKTKAAIGEAVPYSVKVSVPALVNYYNASIIDTLPAGMTADTDNVTITCTTVTTSSDCLSTIPSQATPLAASGSKVGWYLGDITSASEARVITLTYNAKASDVAGNVTGTSLLNTANLVWNATSGAAPTSAGASFARTSTATTATVVVSAPALNVTKVVDNTAPQVDDTLHYTVTISNTGNSMAYNSKATDTIPTGVVVDPNSITNAGILTGQTANGGGTITWIVPTIGESGGTQTLKYTAKLADASALSTGSSLVNSFKVVSYNSVDGGGRQYGATNTAQATVKPIFPAITLSKTPSAGTVAYVNKPFAWTLKLTNGSTAGVASSVIATDTLPKNWTYTANSAFVTDPATGTATQVEPTITTADGIQTLVWTVGPFAAGKTATINYTAAPGDDALTAPGIGQSNAHINKLSAVAKDNNGADHNATANYAGPSVSANAFIGSADVAITNTATGSLVAGQSTPDAWEINVRNNGDDTAVGPFNLSDVIGNLPAGVTITSVTGAGWSCTTPDKDGNFTCVRTNANDTLAKGASFPTITVGVDVAPEVVNGTVVKNNATVYALTTDPDHSNNVAPSLLTVATKADLSIVKNASGDFNAGEVATWTIDVSNAGPSVSHKPTTITDTIPDGVTDVAASGTGWDVTITGNKIVATTDDLIGAANRLTVTGKIDSSFTGDISNTATVAGGETDPNADNNTSTAKASVGSDTSISVQKTLTSGVIVPGKDATYKIDINNTGLADARNVIVTDTLPAGLTYAGNLQSLDGKWSASVDGSTITFTLDGSLSAKSDSDTASLSFDVHTASSLKGDVTNIATGDADNASSNSGVSDGNPQGEADLAVTTKANDDSVVAGGDTSFAVNVTNNGPSDHSAPITVTNTVPDGTTITDVSGAGWECKLVDDGKTITCVLPDGLNSGESAPAITVDVHVDPSVRPSTVTDQSSVTGSDSITDTNLTNNASSASVNITNSSDVTIVKTGADKVVAGTDTTYTIKVTNAGPSNASTVVVTDALPAGLTLVDINGEGWNCDTDSASCTMDELAVGASTITVKAHVASSVANGDDITNTASVTWAGTGVNSVTSSATSGNETSADLSLTKVAKDATVNAGDQDSYDLTVFNDGPSDAKGDVVVTDTLPAGTSFVGSDGPWTCEPDAEGGQDVVCTLNDNAEIPSGGTAALLTINVQFAANLASGTVTNSAKVVSGTDDPNLDNNTATADVDVKQKADITVHEERAAGVVHIGDPISYDYTVHNNGPSDAANVTTTVHFPAGVTDINSDGSDDAWSCVVGDADADGTDVICTLTGTLAAGKDAPKITLTGTVTSKSYPEITNTVKVSTSTTETNLDNNDDSVKVAVPALVKLDITKKHIGDIKPGKDAHYQITVTNDGETEAPRGFTVIDTLPATLTYKSSTVSEDGSTCAVDDKNVVTCVLGDDFKVGDTATVDLYVTVAKNAKGTIENVAAVSTDSEQEPGATTTASDDGTVIQPPVVVTPPVNNPVPPVVIPVPIAKTPVVGPIATGVVAPVVNHVLAFTGTSIPVWIIIWSALAAMALGLVLMIRNRRRNSTGKHTA
jgi:uncharacterized repeat protein (TIGR01451 family)/fimbrial isopeptide formation D2 family protein